MARLKKLTIEVHTDVGGKHYVYIEGIGKGQYPEAKSLEFKAWTDEIEVHDFRKPGD